MATFEISPLFRSSTVAMDRPWASWHTAMSFDGAGEPAYNVLKLDDDEYRISLAVPGMSRDDISIETREGSVSVKGTRGTDPHHNQYLFRGIPSDGFQWTFQLPEHVKVQDARLELGMLHINLVRELPEALKPRRIEISNGAQAETLIQDTSVAA